MDLGHSGCHSVPNLILFLSSSQGTNQHDVQELNRILFSALEHSLVDTSGSTFIHRLYHGTIVNSIVCKECGNVSQRQVCPCVQVISAMAPFYEVIFCPLNIVGSVTFNKTDTKGIVPVQQITGLNSKITN